MTDLEAALDLAREGDERGFAVLWTELHPPLLRFLWLRNPALAEDLAGEVWLQAVRDLARFRGGATDFRAWLFTIARNRANDAYRSRRRGEAYPAQPEAFTAIPAVGGTEDAAFEAMSLDRALRLLRGLPNDQRDAVALRVIAGLDVARTAEILGKSRGAVRVATHRGLRSLADRLAPSEESAV